MEEMEEEEGGRKRKALECDLPQLLDSVYSVGLLTFMFCWRTLVPPDILEPIHVGTCRLLLPS